MAWMLLHLSSSVVNGRQTFPCIIKKLKLNQCFALIGSLVGAYVPSHGLYRRHLDDLPVW